MDTNLFKVGVTVAGRYVHGTEYDMLTQVYYDQEDGGDGCSYISRTPNKNIIPGTNPEVWVLCSKGGDKGDDGKSAYQVAVDNGYVGTQQQWLDSLVGPQGAKGDTGEKGEQGLQGNTGSSVAYPFELVNNRTTDDATKALSAAEGKRLGDDIGQMRDEVGELETVYINVRIANNATISGAVRWHTGLNVSSDNYVRTTYIPVSQYRGMTLTYNNFVATIETPSSSTSGNGMCFYDSEDEVIPGKRWVYGAAVAGQESTTVTIPSDAVTVRFCTGVNFPAINADVSVPKGIYQSGIGKDVQDMREDVDDIISSSTKTVTENYPSVAGVLYDGTVGNALESVTDSSYNSIIVSGLVAGNSITAHCYPGSSYYNVIKAKNGIVTAVGSKGYEYSGTTTCDGSYDTIVYNSYNLRLNPTTASVSKAIDSFEYTDFKLGHIDDDGGNSLNVLCFGNSFTQGSMGYVPAIIHKLVPDLNLKIAMAVIGGSPLAQHYAYFTGNEATISGYTYRIDTETGKYQRITSGGSVTFNGGYTVLRSVNGGAWSQISSAAKIEDLITQDSTWDIITFQQNGNNADDSYDIYFAPFIYGLQKNVISRVSYPMKLGWILTHGAYKSSSSQRYAAWQGTANNAKKVMELSAACVLLPYGTAVQNLRTTSLDSLGDYGGGMQQDDGHMQQGIGDLTSAYAIAIALLKEKGINIGIYGDNFMPTAPVVRSLGINWNVGTGPIGVSESNAILAQIAAVKAVENPYSVTDIGVIERSI